VKAAIRTCWQIFLLRSTPQVFPKSWLLFVIVSCVYFATDAITFLAQGIGGLNVLEQTAFDSGLQVVFFALLLSAKSCLPRLNQTVQAWFGASVFINLLSVPLNLADRFTRGASGETLVFVLGVLLGSWSILVMAHVLRHSLDIGLAFGFVIAVVYFFGSLALMQLLFPAA
jgi:hypothetical protein